MKHRCLSWISMLFILQRVPVITCVCAAGQYLLFRDRIVISGTSPCLSNMAGTYTLNAGRYSNANSYTKASTGHSIWNWQHEFWLIGPTSGIGGEQYNAFCQIPYFSEPYFPQTGSGWRNVCSNGLLEVSQAQYVRDLGDSCENCPAGQSSSAGGACENCYAEQT